MNPFISIIVPVLNGEKYIELCLESLLIQTYPKDRYEVVIVDNGSSDKSMEIAKNYKVILTAEKKKGSYAARNAGIKKAKGEIIGFTDIDCIASDDWLEQAVKYFSLNPNAAIVSGKVKFFSNATLTAWGYFDKNTFLNQEYSFQAGVAKTANLFVKSKLFIEISLFNDELYSGGDIHWTAEAVKKGFNIHYEPKAIVFHPVRNSFSEMVRKCFRVGVGKGQILKKGSSTQNSTNLNIFHLKHPFNLLWTVVLSKEKKISILFPIYLSFVVFILGLVFCFGIIKGLLRACWFFVKAP